jgi:hypothetical protein
VVYGHTYRPLEVTIGDETSSPVRLVDLDMPGLSRTRELELIDEWHAVVSRRRPS